MQHSLVKQISNKYTLWILGSRADIKLKEFPAFPRFILKNSISSKIELCLLQTYSESLQRNVRVRVDDSFHDGAQTFLRAICGICHSVADVHYFCPFFSCVFLVCSFLYKIRRKSDDEIQAQATKTWESCIIGFLTSPIMYAGQDAYLKSQASRFEFCFCMHCTHQRRHRMRTPSRRVPLQNRYVKLTRDKSCDYDSQFESKAKLGNFCCLQGQNGLSTVPPRPSTPVILNAN